MDELSPARSRQLEATPIRMALNDLRVPSCWLPFSVGIGAVASGIYCFEPTPELLGHCILYPVRVYGHVENYSRVTTGEWMPVRVDDRSVGNGSLVQRQGSTIAADDMKL